jgi:transcription-repair coupling factor (superfamily II helicase)
MSALKQYSTLGSGFKIAMRDLEIRGAGNLLGAEQSGHITAIGFELYCQLLKQSIARSKGQVVKPRVEVEVHLDFLAEPAARPSPPGAPTASASIPLSYISDARQRIEIYRKLAQVTEPAGVAELEKEVTDRFGPPPAPLRRLLHIARLKVLAAGRGIRILEVKGDKLMLTRGNDYIMPGGKFPRLASRGAAARLKEIERLVLAA